jgi:hypothetical protein
MNYLRFDAAAENLRACGEQWIVPWQFLPGCPLSLDFDSEIAYQDGCYAQVAPADSVLHIGSEQVQTTVKAIGTGPSETYHAFAADIGLARFGFWREVAWVSYARVGDVEYGQPFRVSRQKPPAEPSASTASAFPNPAITGLNLHFELDSPGDLQFEMFDALGRMVLQRHLGRWEAGDHAMWLDLSPLPSGHYLVRLSVDGRLKAITQITRISGR